MPPIPKRKKPLTEALRPPLACMGIYPPDPVGNQPVSLRSYIVMFGMGIYIVLSAAFFVFEPLTFQSFADCFWITTTTIIMFFVSATLIVKRKKLFDIIDNFEDIIEQCKRHSN